MDSESGGNPRNRAGTRGGRDYKLHEAPADRRAVRRRRAPRSRWGWWDRCGYDARGWQGPSRDIGYRCTEPMQPLFEVPDRLGLTVGSLGCRRERAALVEASCDASSEQTRQGDSWLQSCGNNYRSILRHRRHDYRLKAPVFVTRHTVILPSKADNRASFKDLVTSVSFKTSAEWYLGTSSLGCQGAVGGPCWSLGAILSAGAAGRRRYASTNQFIVEQSVAEADRQRHQIRAQCTMHHKFAP